MQGRIYDASGRCAEVTRSDNVAGYYAILCLPFFRFDSFQTKSAPFRNDVYFFFHTFQEATGWAVRPRPVDILYLGVLTAEHFPLQLELPDTGGWRLAPVWHQKAQIGYDSNMLQSFSPWVSNWVVQLTHFWAPWSGLQSLTPLKWVSTFGWKDTDNLSGLLTSFLLEVRTLISLKSLVSCWRVQMPLIFAMPQGSVRYATPSQAPPIMRHVP